MLVYVFIYVAILVAIGVWDYFKVKNFEDFAVAGKKQSLSFVVMSFMATMIGASATIGIMDKVKSIGFPAFWWLAVGSVGLLFQSLFLSKKIRELNVNTLPELVEKLTGKIGQKIVAIVIAISWPAIVASQIIAMSSIIALITGKENNKTIVLIVALVVIAYTAIGGQLSVVKTDAIQFVIIICAFISAMIYVFAFGNGDNDAVLNSVELVNENFKWTDLIIQFFVVGGAYLLGPDVVSRNLLAKDGKTAKRASLISGIILFVFSVVIVLTGIWVIINCPELGDVNPLIYLINNVLPKPVGVLLAIGILSTILSSTDTCLVNISSIVENDILKRNKVWEMRLWAVVIGIIAIVIAFYKSDIIAILSGAYSVYTPGVVFPLLVAICSHGKRKICIPIWLAAVILGGACGIISTFIITSLDKLPLVGMGISLVLSLIAISVGGKIEESKISNEQEIKDVDE